MPAPLLLAFLLAAAPAAADPFAVCPPAPVLHAAAPETALELDTQDGRLSGTLAAPDAPPRALALLLHGYTGARNEIPVAGGEGMFARTARLLAERGVASLRIDFIGSGRSSGDWKDTRFDHQARDAARAAAALRAAFAPDLPLGALGYSQGGLVALRAAARDAPFDRLALWNPVMDPMETYGVIFDPALIRAGAARHAEAPDDPAPFGGTRLRAGFFADIAAAEPIADAARADAPALVVTGRRDPLVKRGAALAARLAERRTAPTLILDLDAGHDLGAIREPQLLDQVIACTAGFLLEGP